MTGSRAAPPARARRRPLRVRRELRRLRPGDRRAGRGRGARRAASASARDDIDRALAKLDAGDYGAASRAAARSPTPVSTRCRPPACASPARRRSAERRSVHASPTHLGGPFFGSLLPLPVARGRSPMGRGGPDPARSWRSASRLSRADRRESIGVARRTEAALATTEHAGDAAGSPPRSCTTSASSTPGSVRCAALLATSAAVVLGPRIVEGWVDKSGFVRRSRALPVPRSARRGPGPPRRRRGGARGPRPTTGPRSGDQIGFRRTERDRASPSRPPTASAIDGSRRDVLTEFVRDCADADARGIDSGYFVRLGGGAAARRRRLAGRGPDGPPRAAQRRRRWSRGSARSSLVGVAAAPPGRRDLAGRHPSPPHGHRLVAAAARSRRSRQNRDLENADQDVRRLVPPAGPLPELHEAQLDQSATSWGAGMDVAWCTPRAVVLTSLTALGDREPPAARRSAPRRRLGPGRAARPTSSTRCRGSARRPRGGGAGPPRPGAVEHAVADSSRPCRRPARAAVDLAGFGAQLV